MRKRKKVISCETCKYRLAIGRTPQYDRCSAILGMCEYLNARGRCRKWEQRMSQEWLDAMAELDAEFPGAKVIVKGGKK